MRKKVSMRVVKCVKKGTQFVLPVAVDGGWGAWDDGPCSQTCGTASRFRYRPCDRPAPQNGGQSCIGKSEVFEWCDWIQCPGNELI